jgi:hypothetical protein
VILPKIPGLALCLAAILAAQEAGPQGYRIAPVDDTDRDPGFRNFAAKLNKIAVKKDWKGLKKLTDEEVLTGTGRKGDPEEKGWKAFVARWRPEAPDSPVWEVLTDILSLGCVRAHPRLYVGPYLVWKFPRELDRRSSLVLTKDRLVLRETPDRSGRPLETLAFDVVERMEAVGRGEGGQWIRIRVHGKEGYIQSQFAHSVMTPRAQFAEQDSNWKLVALEVPQ